MSAAALFRGHLFPFGHGSARAEGRLLPVTRTPASSSPAEALPRLNRKHDQTYKNAFSNRRAVADLVGSHAAPDLASQLDFSTLAPLPASHVDSGMSSRRGDLLWKVHFRDSSAVMLMVIEFQSRPDPQMAIRVQEYVVLALRYALKNKLSGPSGGPPPVLPVVVYNGKRAWTSPRSLGEMTAPVPGLPPPGEYVLVDMLRLAGEDLQKETVVSWLARLEQDWSPENVRAVTADVLRELCGKDGEPLRHAFRDWVLGAVREWDGSQQVLETIKSLEEATEMYAMIRAAKKELHQQGEAIGLKRGEAIGLKQGEAIGLKRGEAIGLEQGLKQGRDAVVWMASQKFGLETGERLELKTSLAELADVSEIVRVVQAVVESSTREEMLDRVRKICWA